jgi:nitrate/nitrite transporter NarK
MVGYLYAGPLPHQVILSQWFRRNRGLAIGLAYLGLGLGGALSQKYVALPQIAHFGWRTALIAMGGSMLLVLPLLWRVVRDRPADKGLAPDGDPAPPPEMRLALCSFTELLRRRAFWLLAVVDRAGVPEIFAVLFGFGLGADFMLIPLMAAHQFGANSLARVMGIVLPADSIGQTCFPFLLGVLHDRFGNYHSGLLIVFALPCWEW